MWRKEEKVLRASEIAALRGDRVPMRVFRSIPHRRVTALFGMNIAEIELSGYADADRPSP